jgi:predicted RND superfamily exporter protein
MNKVKYFIKKHKIISVVLVLFIIGCIGNALDSKKSNTSNTASADQTNTSIQTQNIKPTKTEEKKPDTFEGSLKKSDSMITDIQNNTGGNGYILITVDYGTKKKSRLSLLCYNTLKELVKRDEYKSFNTVAFMYVTDFKDKYGNVSKQKYFSVEFPKSELDKIN